MTNIIFSEEMSCSLVVIYRRFGSIRPTWTVWITWLFHFYETSSNDQTGWTRE